MSPPIAIYHPSVYTRQGLIDSLHRLIVQMQPNKIGVQDYVGGTGDHPDHRTGAHFVLAALQSYRRPVTVVGYLDYAILAQPSNLDAQNTALKEAAWLAYLPYDNQVSVGCRTTADCLSPGNYGNYWSREYTITPTIKLPN